MASPWLVHAITGRIRVKSRDEGGVLRDQDFDTEAEARAFGGSLLEFGGGMEIAMLMAAQLQRAEPWLTGEEALERAGGIETVKFSPSHPDAGEGVR